MFFLTVVAISGSMAVLLFESVKHVKDNRGEHWVVVKRVRGGKQRTWWFNCKVLGCKEAEAQCRAKLGKKAEDFSCVQF